MAKVTSHAVHNNAILYILRMHIVHQTTPCAPSSNMLTLSYLLLQLAFSQHQIGMQWSMHQASSCSATSNQVTLLFVSGWLNAVYQASIWLNAVH